VEFNGGTAELEAGLMPTGTLARRWLIRSFFLGRINLMLAVKGQPGYLAARSPPSLFTS